MGDPAVDLAKATSIAYALHSRGDVMIDGIEFDLPSYPYLRELYDRNCRMTTILKGAQMGFTIEEILRLLLTARMRKMRGILYLFPSDSEVQDFAKSRWNRIAQDNPDLMSGVRATDSATLKQIGDTYIYFRGAGQRGVAHGSTSKLKSIPIDELVEDESDEMAPERRDAAGKRLTGSKDPRRTELSTPTLPDYGVDWSFQRSDQRGWFWQCERCKGHNCLEAAWPDCVGEASEPGEFVYLCSKCREPLERTIGQWVPRYPDRSKDHLGYHASQMCSPTQSATDIMRAQEEAEETGRMREFTNQTLALPYAEVEDKLTDALLNACLGREPRAPRAEGPTFMGVDPGSRQMHWVVGQRITAKDWEVLNWGVEGSFDEIGKISKKFNVSVGVMDQGAEKHAVRSFVADHTGWWGCLYLQGKKGKYHWDPRERVVSVDRSESLSASHEMITDKRVVFPRPDQVYEKKVKPQMKNIAKLKHEDPKSGDITYSWVVTGAQKNDHLRHAFNYASIAFTRSSLASRVRRGLNRGVTTPPPPSAMSA